MAHFAELDENNEVIRVVVIHNDSLLDDSGVESENIGRALCERLYGGRWVQTSYNGNFRVRFAGVGHRYDEELDAFIPRCAYPSWTLVGVDWQPPVPYPSQNPPGWTLPGPAYWWDEENLQWSVRTDPTSGSGE